MRWGIVGYATGGAGAESAPDSPASVSRGTGRGEASQGSTRGGPPTPTEPNPLHERSPSQKKSAPKIQLNREQTQTRPTTRSKSDCRISVSRFRPVWIATGAIMMFTPSYVAKHSPSHPDEPRVVGAGRDRRSRRRSGRERSAPAPISRCRSGHIRPSKEQGRAGTQQRGDRRDLVPGAGTTPIFGRGCLP